MLQRIHQPVRTKQPYLSTSFPNMHIRVLIFILFLSERSEIDKAAATRFIKHAIQQAQWKKTAAEADDDEDPPPAIIDEDI